MSSSSYESPPMYQPSELAHETAVNIARNITKINTARSKAAASEEGKNEEYDQREFSRKKKDIARGKKKKEREYTVSVEEEEDVHMPDVDQAKEFEEDLVADLLRNLRFHPTRYPHRSTMEALGIYEDFMYLAGRAGLSKLMSMQFESYPEETCQFLGSLDLHFYENEPDMQSDGGLGYITFRVHGQRHTLTFRQIGALYGFVDGSGLSPDVEKDELRALWRTIGGKSTYTSSRAKASDIRNPTIRYMHKAIASTLFARYNIGTVNEGELQMLDICLKESMGFVGEGDEKMRMMGDKNESGNTLIMLNQLMYYKDYAKRVNKTGQRGELSVGGMVTPMLHASGINMLHSKQEEPTWLDLEHLKTSRYLAHKQVDGQFVYRFTHPQVGEAEVLLPLTAIPKLSDGYGAEFDISPQLLHFPQPQQTQRSPPFGDEFSSEPERYYFDDEKCSNLKDANKKIGLLQKWNKFQDKTIKKLKGSVKNLTETVQEMSSQIKALQNKFGGSSSRRPSLHPRQVIRRSSSFTTVQRHLPTHHHARRSNVESRRRRRRTEHTSEDLHIGSTATLGPSTESALLDLATRATDLSLAPGPSYTQESMGDFVTSYFSNE